MNKAPPVQAVKAGLCPINNGGFFFHSFGHLLKMEQKYYWALSQAKKKQRKVETEEMS